MQLDLRILAQPTQETCGPTCLHALYRYYGDALPLDEVVAQVRMLEDGGTLSVMLGCHALARGYRVTIHSYNLHLFDPTWFKLARGRLQAKLIAQARVKKDHRLRAATQGYLEFLERGGQLQFEDLSKGLIRHYLNQHVPILTGLSATYLYHCARERGSRNIPDDTGGEPTGHFVVLSGYNSLHRTVLVGDPLRPNPLSRRSLYPVAIDRVLGSILLGIVTHDANLLVIQPN